MKKIAVAVVSMLCVAVMAIMLAACAPSFVGTYKFQSLHGSMGFIEVNLTAGEDYMGMSISEDFVVLEIKDDGTFTLSMAGGEETEVGTWTADGDKIALDIDGEAVEATLKDGVLTMSYTIEGIDASINLKKQ